MTLGEFVDLVRADELTDIAIDRKWKAFCEILMDLDVERVKDFIQGGLLDEFVDCEAEDIFGTEGLDL